MSPKEKHRPDQVVDPDATRKTVRGTGIQLRTVEIKGNLLPKEHPIDLAGILAQLREAEILAQLRKPDKTAHHRNRNH